MQIDITKSSLSEMQNGWSLQTYHIQPPFHAHMRSMHASDNSRHNPAGINKSMHSVADTRSAMDRCMSLSFRQKSSPRQYTHVSHFACGHHCIVTEMKLSVACPSPPGARMALPCRSHR